MHAFIFFVHWARLMGHQVVYISVSTHFVDKVSGMQHQSKKLLERLTVLQRPAHCVENCEGVSVVGELVLEVRLGSERKGEGR